MAAGRFTLPEGEALGAAVTAFEAQWNESHAESPADLAGEGYSAEVLGAFAASLTAEQAGPSAEEAAAELAAGAGAFPVVGAEAAAAALGAWNAPAAADTAAAGAAEAAAPPAQPAAVGVPALPEDRGERVEVAGGAASGAGNAAHAAAAAKAAAEDAARAAVVAEEQARFGALVAEYKAQEFFKNKVKRTGWTKPLPGYQPAMLHIAGCGNIRGCSDDIPICCNNSWMDFGIILGCFTALYGAVGLFFWIILEFETGTDDSNGALWIFAALVALWWTTLMLTAWAGPAHNAAVKAEHDAADLEAMGGEGGEEQGIELPEKTPYGGTAVA